jgi:hypothetical protein
MSDSVQVYLASIFGERPLPVEKVEWLKHIWEENNLTDQTKEHLLPFVKIAVAQHIQEMQAKAEHLRQTENNARILLDTLEEQAMFLRISSLALQ